MEFFFAQRANPVLNLPDTWHQFLAQHTISPPFVEAHRPEGRGVAFKDPAALVMGIAIESSKELFSKLLPTFLDGNRTDVVHYD